MRRFLRSVSGRTTPRTVLGRPPVFMSADSPPPRLRPADVCLLYRLPPPPSTPVQWLVPDVLCSSRWTDTLTRQHGRPSRRLVTLPRTIRRVSPPSASCLRKPWVFVCGALWGLSSVSLCVFSHPHRLKIHRTRHHFVAKQIATSSDPASLQTGPRCASVVKFLKLLHVDFED